jgi:hypothetical protein
MWRAAFTFVGSLLICLSFAGMWIVSWIFRPSHLSMTAGYCTSYPTVLGAFVEENRMPEQPCLVLAWIPWYGVHGKRYSFDHFGVTLNIRSYASGELFWMLIVKFWIPQLAALLLMVAALRSVRHQYRLPRRMRNYICVQCGYDLRATPDRCPECGGIVEKII